MAAGNHPLIPTGKIKRPSIRKRTRQLNQEYVGKHPIRIHNLWFQKVLYSKLHGWNGRQIFYEEDETIVAGSSDSKIENIDSDKVWEYFKVHKIYTTVHYYKMSIFENR